MKNLESSESDESEDDSDDNNSKESDESEKQKEIELYEKISHFASIAQDKLQEKIEHFLNSADYISDFMKNYNPKMKEKDPKKFINIEEVIKKPGLLIKEKED
jgi:uncharacterized protein YccT (UPF0319 family)